LERRKQGTSPEGLLLCEHTHKYCTPNYSYAAPQGSMDDLFLTFTLIKRNCQEDQEEKIYPDLLHYPKAAYGVESRHYKNELSMNGNILELIQEML
jgi:hypothetical protein